MQRITAIPSVKASIETSSPSNNSSITIDSPAEPNFLSIKISSIALHASSLFFVTITPFPAARPEAFITSAGNCAL